MEDGPSETSEDKTLVDAGKRIEKKTWRKTKVLHDAGTEGIKEDVGGGNEECQDVASLLLLEVDGDGALSSAENIRRRTRADSVDPDNVCPVVREH